MKRPLTPELLGFAPAGALRWRKQIRGRTIEFRELRKLDELRMAERLQRDVMKLSEEDIVRASFLVVTPDTGGFVIGAFEDERELSVAFGYGGYLHPEPFLHSDFLAVVPEAQSLGIGFEMKRLQAALALGRGYESVRWTVDPLRAANARLNFERLGALGISYSRNKYGADFGAGLYGGMPTDRLLLRLPLHARRTRQRLQGAETPRPDNALAEVEAVSSATLGCSRLTISIPGDIDSLVKTDFEGAMQLRMQTRAQFELALDAGYLVSGAARDEHGSRLLLELATRFTESEEEA